MRTISLAILVSALIGDHSQAQWERQQSGTKSRLRGLAAVTTKTVWAGGTAGNYLRTVDGGLTWTAGTVPAASALDFRDIHAVDERIAFLLSSGPGEKSRIYHTADGGETWALRFVNRDPRGFLDAFAFWDLNHGIAIGDPVDGRFTILTTADAGASWNQSPRTNMPLALPAEAAFAASGTSVVVQGDQNGWFGTGGSTVSRVFRTTDRGQSWTVAETPIPAGNPSSGVFSLAFRDKDHGVAVGGDYKSPQERRQNVAITSDGGGTWILPKGPGPGGYRSAVTFVPGMKKPTLVAVGPTGSDLSIDGGHTWMRLGTTGFHAVGFAGPIDAGWGVGDDGLIARLKGAQYSTR